MVRPSQSMHKKSEEFAPFALFDSLIILQNRTLILSSLLILPNFLQLGHGIIVQLIDALVRQAHCVCNLCPCRSW